MAEAILLKQGGGGTGSDECTALREHVLVSYTAATRDSDDEPAEGTMPNRGAVSQTLNAGDSYTVPAGYHSGSGTVTANSLASQTSATAGAGDVLSGKTAYVNGNKITGSMPNRGAVSQALNAGGSYTVPAGYHNGAGKITANSLASQTGGATAGDGDVLTGKTYWKDGVKRTGSMANQGAKTSALNCGGSYTIPAGYHNGSGRVTANSLSSQTSANSAAGDIRSGKTAWVNGAKLTGTLAVTSAISFSAAALSYNTIRISWTNPAKGPWQGVFIQMSTSGNPGTGGGSRVYTGAGNNPNQAGGANYVDIGGLNPGTTYYFTCTSYCDNLGWGSSHNVSAKTKYMDLRDVFNQPGSKYIVVPYLESYESYEETYYRQRYLRTHYGVGENIITSAYPVENDSTWGSWSDGDPMEIYLKYSADVQPSNGVMGALQQYKNFSLFANESSSSSSFLSHTYTGNVTVDWTKLSGGGLNNSGYWIVFRLNRTIDEMAYDLKYYELTLLP